VFDDLIRNHGKMITREDFEFWLREKCRWIDDSDTAHTDCRLLFNYLDEHHPLDGKPEDVLYRKQLQQWVKPDSASFDKEMEKLIRHSGGISKLRRGGRGGRDPAARRRQSIVSNASLASDSFSLGPKPRKRVVIGSPSPRKGYGGYGPVEARRGVSGLSERSMPPRGKGAAGRRRKDLDDPLRPPPRQRAKKIEKRNNKLDPDESSFYEDFSAKKRPGGRRGRMKPIPDHGSTDGENSLLEDPSIFDGIEYNDAGVVTEKLMSEWFEENEPRFINDEVKKIFGFMDHENNGFVSRARIRQFPRGNLPRTKALKKLLKSAKQDHALREDERRKKRAAKIKKKHMRGGAEPDEMEEDSDLGGEDEIDVRKGGTHKMRRMHKELKKLKKMNEKLKEAKDNLEKDNEGYQEREAELNKNVEDLNARQEELAKKLQDEADAAAQIVTKKGEESDEKIKKMKEEYEKEKEDLSKEIQEWEKNFQDLNIQHQQIQEEQKKVQGELQSSGVEETKRQMERWKNKAKEIDDERKRLKAQLGQMSMRANQYGAALPVMHPQAQPLMPVQQMQYRAPPVALHHPAPPQMGTTLGSSAVGSSPNMDAIAQRFDRFERAIGRWQDQTQGWRERYYQNRSTFASTPGMGPNYNRSPIGGASGMSGTPPSMGKGSAPGTSRREPQGLVDSDESASADKAMGKGSARPMGKGSAFRGRGTAVVGDSADEAERDDSPRPMGKGAAGPDKHGRKLREDHEREDAEREHELSYLKEENDVAREEAKHWREKYLEAEEHIEEMENKMEHLADKKHQWEESYNLLLQDFESEERQKQQTPEGPTPEEVESLNRQVAELHQELEAERRQAEDWKRRAEDSAEVTRLHEKVEDLEEELQRSKERRAEHDEDNLREVQRWKEKLEDVAHELRGAREVERELDEARRELGRLRQHGSKANELTLRVSELELQLSILEPELKVWKAKAEDLERSAGGQRQELETLRVTKHHLEAALAQTKERERRDRDDNSQWKYEADSAKKAVQRWENDFRDLRRKVDHESDSMLRRAEDLTKQLEAQGAQLEEWKGKFYASKAQADEWKEKFYRAERPGGDSQEAELRQLLRQEEARCSELRDQLSNARRRGPDIVVAGPAPLAAPPVGPDDALWREKIDNLEKRCDVAEEWKLKVVDIERRLGQKSSHHGRSRTASTAGSDGAASSRGSWKDRLRRIEGRLEGMDETEALREEVAGLKASAGGGGVGGEAVGLKAALREATDEATSLRGRVAKLEGETNELRVGLERERVKSTAHLDASANVWPGASASVGGLTRQKALSK